MSKKSILICGLMILSICCVCIRGINFRDEPAAEVNRAEYQDGLRLVYVKSPVRLGDICSITVEGRPGISYSATCTYMMGNVAETVTQTRVAGNDGRVTWTWYVKPVTTPGTYEVTISGDGNTITTSYTITK